MQNSKLTTKSITYVAMMVGLIAICSWISIPTVVPFTLQTFAIPVALLLLGGKLGLYSILIYLGIGAIGVPVFASFSGGIGALVGPTGGYLLGFILQGLIYVIVIPKMGDSNALKLIALLIGQVLIYLVGSIWFMMVFNQQGNAITLVLTLSMCVLPYIIPDMIKIILAFLLVERVKSQIKLPN